MVTSRTRRKRTGIIGFLGNIADDTKEYVDDLLDRSRDVDRDVRSTARRTLRDDEDDESATEDLSTLKDDLDELTRKVEALSATRPERDQPKKTP